MRILICGGRDFNNWDFMCDTLDALMANIRLPKEQIVIIHGAQRGADKMAGTWARYRGYEVLPFPADWTKYGPAAGSIRNQLMLYEGRPELVVAFPTGGPGTEDMMTKARLASIPVAQFPHQRLRPWPLR